jgi:hypothetical protein
MRTLLMACVASAMLVAGALALPTTAAAMPLAPVAAPRLVDHVQDLCPEMWRCGRFACGWSFVCEWRPEAYQYGPTVYVRPYRAWRRWGHRRHR